MAKSRVTFPDGTIVEIAKDTPPEQIQAILATLKSQQSVVVTTPDEPAKVKMSAEEIWEYGSKKEKLALFIRNHFEGQWFTTIQVRDEQIAFVKRLIFGESSAISTYLNRLTDEGYLDKQKLKRMSYHLTPKIKQDYPAIEFIQMEQFLQRG